LLIKAPLVSPKVYTRPILMAEGSTPGNINVVSIPQGGVSGDQIVVSFDTIPNNQPSTYGNYIAIWQNTDQIPWSQAPLNTQPIDGNTQAGDMTFGNLDVTNNSYIIGYAVGPQNDSGSGQLDANMVASVYVPAASDTSSGTNYPQNSSSLTIAYVGTNTVSFGWEMLQGFLAQSNKSWAGIWRGSYSYTNPPDAVVAISIDSNQGTSSFNGLNLLRGETYNIAFFASGWVGENSSNTQTAIAATIQFTV